MRHDSVLSYTLTYVMKRGWNYTMTLVWACTIVIRSRVGKVTILWNWQVKTFRTIANNKLEIVIRDNEKWACLLLDIAISWDTGMFNTETDKMWQYKDPTVEIQCMWNVKTKRDPIHSRGSWNRLNYLVCHHVEYFTRSMNLTHHFKHNL
jgi:hypothetical protein